MESYFTTLDFPQSLRGYRDILPPINMEVENGLKGKDPIGSIHPFFTKKP